MRRKKKMNIILLSGGSGKRLWPLSNEIRSKQFLRLVQNESGTIESMCQRVYRQIRDAKLNADIAVATSATQVETIKNQLGSKVSIVVEPERRNTFPAIVLSAAHLYFEKNCSLDETVVVIPVDPYVDNRYFETIHKLDEAVQSNIADIVLMGVKPTYPSEKYGYIIPESMDSTVNSVSEFKEKPTKEVAESFIERGGLWNCGVFSFKLSYLIDIMKSMINCQSYEDVERQYGKLEKTSFDYAVVERASSVAVVSYDGEWKDLGTWNTLTEVMDSKPIGDVRMADDCENTHIINELEIPIVIMGAKDMVVAASPDGILVADKEQSSYIKQYVDDIDNRPMFEERAWGDYTVLNISVDENKNKTVTKRKCIKRGCAIEKNIHKSHSEVWTILSGKAVVNINGRNHDALPGDTFTIDRGVPHSLVAVENTILLEVQVNLM